VKSILARIRTRLRLEPPCADVVPRPPRRRRNRPLRLTHALLACDVNPAYLDFWPLARRAWFDVAGLEPVLLLISELEDVPDELRGDDAVHVFAPVPGIHTAFQAQCIRLLYPALLRTEGAVIVSDADMAPLNARYFHRPAARIDESHFLAYRDVLLGDGQIPICYNAALPATWGDVFEVATIADVRRRLEDWGSQAAGYSGARGGEGWVTDQQILYRTLLDYGRRTQTVWIVDDRFTGFRRLERGAFWESSRLSRRDRIGIRRGRYSDFHCPAPLGDFRAVNEAVVELAGGDDARRTRRRRDR
jgi:hypothetical protein